MPLDYRVDLRAPAGPLEKSAAASIVRNQGHVVEERWCDTLPLDCPMQPRRSQRWGRHLPSRK
jgi:hypothetical protein